MNSKESKTPATKEDLEVTKHEILTKVNNKVSKLVTKKEFQETVATLATKEELKATEKRLNDKIEILANQVAANTSELKVHGNEIKALKFEVSELKDGMVALNEKIDNRFDLCKRWMASSPSWIAAKPKRLLPNTPFSAMKTASIITKPASSRLRTKLALVINRF